MAWGLWTCPVDCSLPSSAVTLVAPYGDISGPGVVAGFVVAAGITVLAVTASYFLSSDAHDGIHHEQKNLIDEVVLGSIRKTGRLVFAYADSFIPSRISPWLATILGQDRVRRVVSTSLLALSDIQIFTGLAILINGFVSLCPSPSQPNGLPAYHWQILVHLAWFSTITHQGTLFLMQNHSREHRWQRNVRLLLMCALLVLLMIAMVPTAYFNWYSERGLVQLDGPSDTKGLVPDGWLVSYPMLARSAAQPVSPTSCYFDVSSANDLYLSADPCRWGDFTPLRPPRLTDAAALIIRRVIMYENANLFAITYDEAGSRNLSSPSLDFNSTRERYCDLHTPLSGTDSFQAAALGMATVAILIVWNAARLFGYPSSFFRRRIRNPIGGYSRRAIEHTSSRAMRMFPTTGHRPDLAESLVTTPLLALHLTGRLLLDMSTSKLAKVLLLIFAFVQGCMTLYPAHDPYFHKIQHGAWTFGQILAVLGPLSPLALVVPEVFKRGSRAWHTSSHQTAHPTPAAAITQSSHTSHDRGIGLRAKNDGHSEADVTELDARQIRETDDQGEDSVGPDGATSVLDSPEYRSSKWMSIAVWLLVVTVTLLASAQIVYVYVGFSGPERLPILLSTALDILPASCYAWALMGLSIRSQAAHYASGYRHGSRFITWITTPNASQLMMFTAVFSPIGVIMLTLLDVLGSQNPSPLG
ncbi:hypothetical protein INS49_004587 [Diaporthe citri]|uniref:uncharacterized protein n=1 Tax=Diaporthe citri TaxID=83186 RepID=UPI001C82107F|nr:uncharacterized protein INS49_004587 [Diaporthe citri]KAG6354569.1 hypothetical protein INS49_004587 [Diaporthe citri]